MTAHARVISAEDWEQAEEMHLRCEPLSNEATALVDGLLAQLSFPATPGKQDRKSTSERRRKALGALLADLLRLEAKGLAGSRSMKKDIYSQKVLGFGFDVFASTRDAMVAAGLLRHEPGRRIWGSFEATEEAEGFIFGDKVRSRVSRFQLTPQALEEVAAAGVLLGDWEAHWQRSASSRPQVTEAPLPASLVVLKASHRRVGKRKIPGAEMPVDLSHPVVQSMIADLEAHNAFLQEVGVAGVDFTGLRRIFNDGDQPGFAWQRGGRFYSIRGKGQTEAYERLSGPDRRQRVRLWGQPVGEADMSASQLRLLYALLDVELPADLAVDPYMLPGLGLSHREPVKLVVAQALGKGKPRSRTWGNEFRANYVKDNPGRSLAKDYPFQEHQHATLAAHPILERLGGPEVPRGLELQFIESEIIRRAMNSLRLKGIPSLPVHDSLMVPLGDLSAVAGALSVAFVQQVEATNGRPTNHLPRLTLKAHRST